MVDKCAAHAHEDLRGRFVTIHSTSWRDMRTGQLDKVQKMARLGSRKAHKTFFLLLTARYMGNRWRRGGCTVCDWLGVLVW